MGTHLCSRVWLSLTAVSTCSPHPVPTGSVSVVTAPRTAGPPLHVPGAIRTPWPSLAQTLADMGSKPPGVPFPGWPVLLGGRCPHGCCSAPSWLPPAPADQPRAAPRPATATPASPPAAAGASPALCQPSGRPAAFSPSTLYRRTKEYSRRHGWPQGIGATPTKSAPNTTLLGTQSAVMVLGTGSAKPAG